MTITTIGFKSALIAGLLAALSSSILAPTANAGLFDWFSNSGSTNQKSVSSSNDTYVGLNNVVTASDDEDATILIGDSYIAAPNQPTKPSAKNVTQKISRAVKELVVSITGYSSTIDQTDASPFITANGTYVYDGLVAANFLPFHAKIQIPDYFGDKVFTVEDRMNKKFQNRVDVWFPDRESALEFGHRVLKIKILES